MKRIRENFINRLGRAAGWIGMFSGAMALMAYEAEPAFRQYAAAALILSAGLLVFFFIIHFETLKAFSKQRSTRFGANSILMVLVFTGILGIVNFLSSRHHHRIDLSETRKFTLAPQSYQVLENLEREVNVIAFVSEQGSSKPAIQDLLNNYRYTNPMISYSFIDPDKKPSIAKQYGIAQYDTLVFESGSRSTRIKTPSEEEITNAIIRVSKDTQRKILFTTGHGEHSLDDTERNGYDLVRENLEKQGFQTGTLSLLQQSGIPEGTTLLVIAGPQKRFLPQEISVLSQYLRDNGKVLIMADPNDQSGLEPIFSDWGVSLQGGLIIDTLSRLFGGDFTVPVVNTYPDHEITRNFNLATFFPLAQGLDFDTSRGAEYDFRPLAQTSGNSWSKTRIPEDGRIMLDPDKDEKGPFTIAATLTRIPKTGDEETPPQGASDRAMLAVFGDSDFASNSSFHFSGNGDLFLNTVSWMAEEKSLISIRPREDSFSPLFLSRSQGRVLMYVSLIIFPTGILTLGLTIWKRRRRL